MVELPRKAKGQRPAYFSDPAIDKLLSMTLALAGEVSVLRDRIDSIEYLLETGQSISRKAVDDFVPPAALRAERDARRDQFLGIVLRAIHDEREDMAAKLDQSSTGYEAAVEDVETN